MPLVWAWGSCNYWDCFYYMEILWLKTVAVSTGFLWVFYTVTVELYFWLKFAEDFLWWCLGSKELALTVIKFCK